MVQTAVQFALFIVAAALAAFLANRLYVGLSRRELNVKGALYSRTTTPIAYWISMSCALIGLLLTFSIVVGIGAGLLGLA